jgi:putative aldouronate transport system substrate-binding protein
MMLPQLVLTSPDNFDKMWDEYIAGLHGLKIVEANREFSELVRAKAAFWASH